MGLELFSPDDDRSSVVTAIRMPDGVDGAEVIAAVRDRHGMTLEGGRGPLVGKIVRIGHVGYVDVFDVIAALTALEQAVGRARRRRRARERGRRGPRGLRRRPGPRMSETTVAAPPRPETSETARVLVREPIADAGIELLRERFDVDVDFEGDLAETIGLYDALIVRSATKVTRELIERGERLKVIGRAGVGVDNVDLDAASERGHRRRERAAVHRHLRRRAHDRAAPRALAEHPAGPRRAPGGTLGAIALRRARARRARRSGSSASAASATRSRGARSGSRCASSRSIRSSRPTASAPSASTARETLDEVLAEADFITLHLTLTDETRGLIGADELARAKDGVRLVNVARGELVDEDALADALRSGKVAGAALDVFSEEPYSGPLLELENVVATPHLGASTEEAQDRAGVIVAEQVAAALDGRRRHERGEHAGRPDRRTSSCSARSCRSRPTLARARVRARGRHPRPASTSTTSASSPPGTRGSSRSPR